VCADEEKRKSCERVAPAERKDCSSPYLFGNEIRSFLFGILADFTSRLLLAACVGKSSLSTLNVILGFHVWRGNWRG